MCLYVHSVYCFRVTLYTHLVTSVCSERAKYATTTTTAAAATTTIIIIPFLLLARDVPNVAKEEYMRSVQEV